MSGGMYSMIGAALGGGLTEMTTARMAAQLGQMMNTFLSSYANLAWTHRICTARRLPRPTSVEKINRRLVARLLDAAIVRPRTGREEYLDELVGTSRLTKIQRNYYSGGVQIVAPFQMSMGSSMVQTWIEEGWKTPSATPWQEWTTQTTGAGNGVFSVATTPIWIPGKRLRRFRVGIHSELNSRVWTRRDLPRAESFRVDSHVTLTDQGIGKNSPFWFTSYRNGQIHCDHGPAVYDGQDTIYALNGVQVPDWLITTPASRLDPARFTTIYNAEVRREFVRKVGIDMIIQRCGAKVVDKRADYELLSLQIPVGAPGDEFTWLLQRMTPGDREWRYLKMKNPSIGTWHVEGVPNQCRTVMEALRWREPVALQRIPRSENGQPYQQQGDVYIWPKDAKFLKPMPEIVT